MRILLMTIIVIIAMGIGFIFASSANGTPYSQAPEADPGRSRRGVRGVPREARLREEVQGHRAHGPVERKRACVMDDRG